MVISTFRAQGNLTERKLELLRELRALFRIPVDRHKAELRRAANDEALHTIARRLSHGECFSKEWSKHAKRFVPLLPRLNTESDSFYRILADHIVAKSQLVLDLYPPCDTEENAPAEDLDYDMKEEEGSVQNEDDHVYKNNLTEKLDKLKQKQQQKQQMQAANCSESKTEGVERSQSQNGDLGGEEALKNETSNDSIIKNDTG